MNANRSRPGASYQQPVTISLNEAFNGTARQLQTESRHLEVRIPPGVKTGSKVRVAKAGPQDSDLYLVIEVADDPRFERDGTDLRTTASVDIFTAVLGGEAEVETMTGKVKLNIPAGTQPEQVFRLAGRGMPNLKNRSEKGDLYVRLIVQVPRYLSAKQTRAARGSLEDQILEKETTENETDLLLLYRYWCWLHWLVPTAHFPQSYPRPRPWWQLNPSSCPKAVDASDNQELLVAIYRQVNPGVVAIKTVGDQAGSLGSGFVYDTQGTSSRITTWWKAPRRWRWTSPADSRHTARSSAPTWIRTLPSSR